MKRIICLILAVTAVVGILAQTSPAVFAATTTVTVTDPAGLNIRQEPDADSAKVGSLTAGTQVTVSETRTVGQYIWGRIDNGWIRLDFTDYAPAKNGWVQENGSWYYYKENVKQTGWLNLGSNTFYLQSDGKMLTGTHTIDGVVCVFDANGVLTSGGPAASVKNGWKKENEIWYYYQNGVKLTGWLQLGPTWYYLKSDGAMATGWLQVGSQWFYFKDSGAMVTGKVLIGTVPHKFNTSGVWLGQAQYYISDDCMRLLKLEEGFSTKPYWDYAQWTVGYGTKCPDHLVDYYKEHGITDAEAEQLLRDYLAGMEATLENFIAKYNLTLKPNEYDAIALFSYNCGTGWTTETSGTFFNAIKNRATGNDLIRAFALWCSAGGQIKEFLMRRRLCEANIYLNGVYSQTPPNNYCYVLYDANGGSTSPRSQGYDSDLTAKPYPVPTYAGYTFDGWYTAKTGGTKITTLTAAQDTKTLYAHWKDASGNAPVTGNYTVVTTVTNSYVNLRQGPGTQYDTLTTKPQANLGDQLTIVETQAGGSYQWGRFTEHGGGWVCLDYTNYYEALKEVMNPGRWALEGGKWYYYIDDVRQTGWQQVNGKWYYLNSSGVMTTGWQKVNGKWYYLDGNGAMQTGWLQEGTARYYLHSDGVMATGWQKIGNSWYYFNSSGVMKTGWLLENKTYYYLNSDGTMATGWLTLGQYRYYLDSNGKMLTGTHTIDEVECVFNAQGVLTSGGPAGEQTPEPEPEPQPVLNGWKAENGTWYYYRNGEKAKGWLLLNHRWYYLKSDGAMATGWLKLGSVWYYLNADGVMQTGWLKLGSTWYYLSADGVMKTGWLKLGNTWYYMNTSGAMVTGTVTIGGVKHKFNSSGVWLG